MTDEDKKLDSVELCDDELDQVNGGVVSAFQRQVIRGDKEKDSNITKRP